MPRLSNATTAADSMGEAMSKKTTGLPLWKHVGELGGFSAALLYLADVGSDRLSVTQTAFFLLAATADAAGKPATRAQLIATYPDFFRGSARNSYRQLLPPSRVYPNGLGWLVPEENPDDLRENVLRLSDEGRSVIMGVLLALSPLEPNKASDTTN